MSTMIIISIIAVAIGIIIWRKKFLEQSKEPIDIARRNIRDGKNPWSEYWAYNIVRDRILKLLSNTSVRNDYICAFKEEGLYSEENIEIIQAILIYRVSRALVTSGDYHVYRGLLNHLGMDMKKMCLATINFLHDKNFLDDEYAENWISTLLEDIRFLG